jgi:hypothetical protein
MVFVRREKRASPQRQISKALDRIPKLRVGFGGSTLVPPLLVYLRRPGMFLVELLQRMIRRQQSRHSVEAALPNDRDAYNHSLSLLVIGCRIAIILN